jgi:hypothetical protein
MKRRFHSSRASIYALAFVAIMMVFGSTVASAIPWNPPCGMTTIVNNTGCTVGICPWWNIGLVPPCAPFIGPGPASVVINTAVPGLQLNGFVTWAGTLLPLIAIPPGAPCAPAATWWVPNITVGPAPGCCVDIYVNPGACRIIVCPSPGPCTP